MEVRFSRSVCRQLGRPQGTGLTPTATRKPAWVRHAGTQHPEQANPLGDYYESLLSNPLTSATLATRQITIPLPQASLRKTTKEETLAKAQVVFGSRLAGPAQRRSEIQGKSTLIAGVWVPPRPEEPDNCCMGGCVNCVWDRYRDEIEEWSTARRAADANIRKEKGLVLEEGETADKNTNSAPSPDKDLFKGIPVGIVEFMRTEKMLKERHAREGTSR